MKIFNRNPAWEEPLRKPGKAQWKSPSPQNDNCRPLADNCSSMMMIWFGWAWLWSVGGATFSCVHFFISRKRYLSLQGWSKVKVHIHGWIDGDCENRIPFCSLEMRTCEHLCWRCSTRINKCVSPSFPFFPLNSRWEKTVNSAIWISLNSPVALLLIIHFNLLAFTYC